MDRSGLFRDDLQRSMTPGIASYYNNIAQNGAFSQVGSYIVIQLNSQPLVGFAILSASLGSFRVKGAVF